MSDIDQEQIRYLGDVQRLVLGPNDKVILTLPSACTQETAARIRASLEEELGIDPQRVLVLADGIKIGVLAAE